MSEHTFPTAYGVARLVTDPVVSGGPPLATVLLSHGAGNGIDARDLEALARVLPRHGFTVVRLEQPWRVAGRKVATAPPTLDVALVGAAESLASRGLLLGPLVVGGRSAGARSACRCAPGLGAAGVLALAFPLHPPGKPEKSRLAELRGGSVPTLLVQGERDTMGRPEEFPEDLDGVDLAVVPGADHGLKVPARGAVSQDEAMEIVVEAVLEWLVRDVVGVGT